MLLTVASCGEHCVPIVMLELLRLCDRMPWRVKRAGAANQPG